MNTQCQAGLLQENSSTAQQVMCFTFPAAATALCLEINRERTWCLEQVAVANIAAHAKKLKFQNESEGHVV